MAKRNVREINSGSVTWMWVRHKPWQATPLFSILFYYKPNDNTVLWPHLLQTGWQKSWQYFESIKPLYIYIYFKKLNKQGDNFFSSSSKKNRFGSTNKCLVEWMTWSTRVNFSHLEPPLLRRQTFSEAARHSEEGWCEKPIQDRGCHLLAVSFLVELFGHFFFFFKFVFASSTSSLRKITCEEMWTRQ